MTPSSSSHTSQSDNDFGRYNRVRRSPQVAEFPFPTQPLSGIEHLIESRSMQLLVLAVENTTKYVQNRLDMEKCCRDWICPQNLVSALASTKFYKSQNQFLPIDNIPSLEADASLLDLSNKGRASVPLKNLEALEKKARAQLFKASLA